MDTFDRLVRVETLLWNRLEASLPHEHATGLGTLQALRILDRHHGHGRVEDLRRELAITNGAASKLVDRMERAGFVVRTPNPDDRRSSLVALTQAGAAAVHAGEAAARAELRRVISTADAQALGPLLARIEERLTDPAPDRDPAHDHDQKELS